MRLYLLGQLPEEERLELEQQFFSDTEAFELVEALEDELVQDYVAGDLPRAQRELLERQLGSMPGMQARLEFARTLHRKTRLQAVPATPRGWLSGWLHAPRLWQLAAAACLGVLLIAIAIAVRSGRTSRAPIEIARTPTETPAHPTSEPNVFALVLTPGLSRAAGDGGRYTMPRNATEVQIKAEFSPKAHYQRYSARLKTADGVSVWSGEVREVQRQSDKLHAIVQIPADRIAPNEYVLTLSGITSSGALEDVEDYSFRVL